MQRPSAYYEFKALFKDLTTDTLKIDCDSFLDVDPLSISDQEIKWKGRKILSSDFRKIGLFRQNPPAYALGHINMNDKVCGFIYGSTISQAIYITVYSEQKERIIFNREIAHYDYMETTYESTMKSWFLDIDSDGDKDIATWESMIDFELPNDYSNNISGDTRFIHFLDQDSLIYDYWDSEKLKSLRFK